MYFWEIFWIVSAIFYVFYIEYRISMIEKERINKELRLKSPEGFEENQIIFLNEVGKQVPLVWKDGCWNRLWDVEK
jgi:hypothetical protein